MKCRKSIRVLGLLVVFMSLFGIAWDRAETSIFQLRVSTIRGANDTDAITIVNPVTFSGAPTVTGTLTVSALMAITPVSATCTNGGSIAVAGSYVKVTPTNVSTATVANAGSAGQLLIIENVGTNALTIEDSTTAMALGSDVVLGATDTLFLVANAAAQWRKLGTSNN